jgi:hypothetical protein
MEDFKKEFVPYDRALKMKELGFDEPCLASWSYTYELQKYVELKLGYIVDGPRNYTNAPTFSQCFRWFREKYGLWFRPDYYDEMKEYNFQGNIHELGKYSAIADIGNHKTPEEAELACLDKLIEIVESKSE